MAKVLGLFLLLAAFVSSQNYGSYIADCVVENNSLVFLNFPEQNCTGTPTKKSYVINKCQTELLIASWYYINNDLKEILLLYCFKMVF